MVAQRNFDTGGSGGGGITNPQKKAQRLGAFSNAADFVKRGLTGDTGGSGSSGTAGNYCPAGSTRVPGKNMCRWNHNGVEFSPITGSSGSSGGGGGGGTVSTMSTTAPAGPADDMTIATESGWLPTAADTFARNPEAMLAALLQDQYGDEAGNTLYASMRPYADAANILFLANRGNTPDGGTKDQFLQDLEAYFGALQTPGARIDYQSMIDNIMNPAEGSALRSYLTTGTSEEQAANFLRLMSGISQTAYHPLIANAMMDRLGLEADRYIGQSGRGAVDPFYQTLDFPNLIPRR